MLGNAEQMVHLSSSFNQWPLPPLNPIMDKQLAIQQQQQQPLKCPRCDSSNTKFCYYNNYSLSQPRHFCKACKRYWTRGGTLRNVPVGGGCRKNKRLKRPPYPNPIENPTPTNNNSSPKPFDTTNPSLFTLPAAKFKDYHPDILPGYDLQNPLQVDYTTGLGFLSPGFLPEEEYGNGFPPTSSYLSSFSNIFPAASSINTAFPDSGYQYRNLLQSLGEGSVVGGMESGMAEVKVEEGVNKSEWVDETTSFSDYWNSGGAGTGVGAGTSWLDISAMGSSFTPLNPLAP